FYARFRGHEQLSGSLWGEIRMHIQDRLIATYRHQKLLTPEQEVLLRGGRHLLDNLFYYLIDNDQSLQSRQRSVYANGLWVTSTLDLSIICFAGYFFHVVLFFVRRSDAHMMWATMCITVSTFSYAVLLPSTLGRHKQLSDLQLDYIDDFYSEE